MDLAELFPDGDYRFHLTLRRGEPRDFFSRQDSSGRVCTERAKWLAGEPARYAALRPEGEPLLAEFSSMLEEWTVAASVSEWKSPLAHTRGYEDLLALGAVLEPDFLFLSPDAEGRFRLRGGIPRNAGDARAATSGVGGERLA